MNGQQTLLERIGRTAAALAMLLLWAGTAAADEPAPPRERLPFTAGWRFTKGDPADAQGKLGYSQLKDALLANATPFRKAPATAPTAPPNADIGGDVSYAQPSFDDSNWRPVNLPHDWGIEGPFRQEYPGETGKLPWWGVGWYRKHFTLPATDAGRRLHFDVDGAMSYAAVWINGHFAGGWPYGYQSFRVDLTPYVKPGADNVLVVRLDNPQDSSRWYPGGGIYRNVCLVKTGPVHVSQWGTYVTTPEVTPVSASVVVRVSVDNRSAADAQVVVKADLFELKPDGSRGHAPVASAEPVTTSVPAEGTATAALRCVVPNPKLWDTTSPNRYIAITTIGQDGRAVDAYPTPFGIRTVRFDPDKGFLLNGQRVRINGVCNHHDLGALGAAINVRAMERQIELLREMGCNAIRTSHNPPAPELLDLCDRTGMLVMDEAFDAWAGAKKKNDYHLLFPDWHEADLRAQVRRDRNHPCVILWSVGNEVREQGDVAGHKSAARLTEIAHEEDPTRPTAAGCNDTRAGYNGFQKTVDVFGYNYKPAEYPKVHAANPSLPILGSETSSCVSSRGEYFFPVSNDKADGRADFQVSSYDLYAPRWAWPPDVEFKGLDENPFVAGEFVWTGFDYLGEPTPYNSDSTNLLNFTDAGERAKVAAELKDLGKIKVPSRSSYFGILDLAGFKKDRFYLYQARWRPDLPMAHILPHWNWPDRVGQVTPVHVYTSGDEAELFLNGTSLGRRRKGPLEYRLRWDDVEYQPGELRVVAYKDGQHWADATTRTTGPAIALALQPDRRTIRADGADLSFVTLTVIDKDGHHVPRSNNPVRFTLAGPGEIVAVDNGDATRHIPFQAKDIHAYNGLALVIVRSRAGDAAPVTLKAEAEGLSSADTVINKDPITPEAAQ